MDDWKTKIVLAPGQSLKHVSSTSKGFMQETDVDTYDVLDVDAHIIGSVVVEDHTAIKGFRRTISVLQKDINGATIVDEAWQG